MKLNKISTLCLLGAAALAGGCQQQDIEGVYSGREVRLSVDVAKPDMGSSTRTALTENSKGDLDCVWTANDNLVVTDLSGEQKGVITLKSDYENMVHGVFDGTLTNVDNGKHQLNFYYLGVYNLNHVDGTSRTLSFSEQAGSEASLGDHDLLKASRDVIIDGDYAYVEPIRLTREVAFGRFKLNLPDGVNAAGQTLTVSGENVYSTATLAYANGQLTPTEGSISVTVQPGNEFFLTLVPGQNKEAITLNFEVTVDDVTYVGTPGQRIWKKGEYVRTDLGNGSFGGKEVEMEVLVPPTPAVDDTVGPVFTINGKKYRFTRGNLKYTLPDSPTGTGVWTILDDQTQFVNAGGLGTDASFTSLGTTPKEIGLFAWGATGLEDARKPWAVRFGGWEQSLAGNYWPSNGTTSTNGSTKSLWDNEYVYDWGRAYMESGRAANDNRQYITPSLAQFEELFKNSFVQGATVNGVQGLLCIPGVTSLDDAKALIRSVDGASCLSSMTSATHNSNGNTTVYKNITITDYDALKRLNDAVFFPAASKRNLSSGKVYNSDGKGWYWSAKTAATTNGYNLYFDCSGESNGGFFYNGGSNNSSMGRFNQMAVRLLVEVTE